MCQVRSLGPSVTCSRPRSRMKSTMATARSRSSRATPRRGARGRPPAARGRRVRRAPRDARRPHRAGAGDGRLPADPRFDDAPLAEVHRKLFVGRSDVLDEVHRLVQARAAPWLALTALPGMGKSALVSRLLEQHRWRPDETLETRPGDLWVFHFCSTVDGRHGPTAALRSLVAQLCDAAGLRSRWRGPRARGRAAARRRVRPGGWRPGPPRPGSAEGSSGRRLNRTLV
jgi:hypothetical protein